MEENEQNLKKVKTLDLFKITKAYFKGWGFYN